MHLLIQMACTLTMPAKVSQETPLWLHAQELKAAREAADEKTQLALVARDQYKTKALALAKQNKAYKAALTKARAELAARGPQAEASTQAAARAAESEAARADEHVGALQVHIKAIKRQLGAKLKDALEANAALQDELATSRVDVSEARAHVSELETKLEVVVERHARDRELLNEAKAVDIEAGENATLAAEASLSAVTTRLKEYIEWEESQNFGPGVDALLAPDAAPPSPRSIDAAYSQLKDAYVRLQYRAELLTDENDKMSHLVEQLRGSNLVLYTHAKIHAASASSAAGNDAMDGSSGNNPLAGSPADHLECQATIRSLKQQLYELGVEVAGMDNEESVVQPVAEVADLERRAEHWETEARLARTRINELESQLAAANDARAAEAAARADSLLASDASLIELQGQLMYLQELEASLHQPRWDALLALPSSVLDLAIADFHTSGREAESLALLEFKHAHEARGKRIELLEAQADQLRNLAAVSAQLSGESAAGRSPASTTPPPRPDAAQDVAHKLFAEQASEREARKTALLRSQLAKQTAIIAALDDAYRKTREIAATEAGLPLPSMPIVEAERDARKVIAKLEAELRSLRNELAEAEDSVRDHEEAHAHLVRELIWLRTRTADSLALYDDGIQEREDALVAKLARASNKVTDADTTGDNASLATALAKAYKRADQLAAVRLDRIHMLRAKLDGCVCGKPGESGTEAAPVDSHPAGDELDSQTGAEPRRGITYDTSLATKSRANRSIAWGDDDNAEEVAAVDSLFAPYKPIGPAAARHGGRRRKLKDAFKQPSPLRLLILPFLAHAMPSLALGLDPDETELQDVASGVASDEPVDLPPLGFFSFSGDAQSGRNPDDIKATDWRSAARKLRHERELAAAGVGGPPTSSDAAAGDAASSSAAPQDTVWL
ncbi:uncharacterized protein AMSG_04810 [Thecamonas trahens ATCC 50062]|uniref:Uncharacterized protein n=1 Tax=Thecamonas trahens ATCC 50062 TaxID=461836 RepID=A0A0L0D8F0_THETB|nr:hypothetical protein AMSG_04810 [Thecamonas trahens ATCC 50062]KNC48361.1 hypothetical protein AMSG_04810 [Thecamonas trahens ATCC 50062]|eukprot:XP_013758481.1 hypothetical protein AMSG_04810 [Thecamonas trahens ATCC 50062]